MNKLCSHGGCKTIVAVDPHSRKSPRCDKHETSFTPKKVYSHHYHSGKNIYYTNRWKKIRTLKQKMNPLCEECLKFELTVPMSDVDHIVEVEDGGEPFDINNTQSLCRSCHNRKSARERKRRNNKDLGVGFVDISGK